MKLSVFIVVLFVVPAVFADITMFDAQFDVADGYVRQVSRFTFDIPLNGTLNYTLPSVSQLSVSDGIKPLRFTAEEYGETYLLTIYVTEPADQIVIEYVADNMIFHLDSVEHFFTEFSFDNTVQNLTASLKLPVGYTLYDNSYKPQSGEIISDGRSIILQWYETDVDNILFSVKFMKPRQEFGLWLATIAVLTASLLFVYFYFRNKRSEDFMFGFRHDEKVAIDYIREKRVALQRDLEEKFKFSRAKATRIVSKLVEKGLVRKQRYGRTNKLTWLK